MLTAYFDESRTDDGEPWPEWPVVAGFLGDEETWGVFNDKWERA